MFLALSRKPIACFSLLLFCLAIYGSAFGSIGCHCVAQGLQNCEGDQSHPPHANPYFDKAESDLCTCDQLSCVLKSRSRVKRHLGELTPVVPFATINVFPTAAEIMVRSSDALSLSSPSQALIHLGTVVLRH